MQNPAAAGEAGAINVYVCEETGAKTWTREVDGGVTPFMIRCRAAGCDCGGRAGATSAMYPREIPDNVIGRWEWYRPDSRVEALTHATKAIDDVLAVIDRKVGAAERQSKILATVDHWAKGGLYMRQSAEPWTPGGGQITKVPKVPGKRAKS